MTKWRTNEWKSLINIFLHRYSRNSHVDASASWYTPQSGVNVHQLTLVAATMDPKEMIWATLEAGTARNVDGFKYLPPRPSKIGKAMTFGIQTKFSNLLNFFYLKFETSFDYGKE
jgi:hypothetical protein